LVTDRISQGATLMPHEKHDCTDTSRMNGCDDASGGLTSLWIEIPPYCHLNCSYCFSGSGREYQGDMQYVLSIDEYRKLLNDFADGGGRDLGIPGSGEPFHPRNETLVKGIIEIAYERGITTTIFTTGETLIYTKEGNRETDYIRRPDDSLAEFLVSRKVALYIKYNSRHPEVQDKLVDMEGYTEKRDEALRMLVERYGLNKLGKIGIVTSLMKANENEIMDLLAFAQENKLIFDCDTILPWGRGKKFCRTFDVSTECRRSIASELRLRQNIKTHPGGTYLSGVCDRIKNHLYVDCRGNVFPCLGARKTILLGNIRNKSIGEIWRMKIRQKMRNEKYAVFENVCVKCMNFLSEECHSCLGRSAEEVQIDAEHGSIKIITKGCYNHRPDFERWMDSIEVYVKTMMAYKETQTAFMSDFESLWHDNGAISYVLSHLNRQDRPRVMTTAANRKILSADVLRDDENLDDIENLRKEVSAIRDKKCFEYGDLNFPVNKIWMFTKTPHDLGIPDDMVTPFVSEVLANVTIPSMKLILGQTADAGELYGDFKFWDQMRERYFCRKFLRHGDAAGNLNMSIMGEWEEGIENGGWGRLMLRQLLGRGREAQKKFPEEYELSLSENTDDVNVKKENMVIDVSPFLNMPVVQAAVRKIERNVSNFVKTAGQDWTAGKARRGALIGELNGVLYAEPDSAGALYKELCKANEGFSRRNTANADQLGLAGFIENVPDVRRGDRPEWLGLINYFIWLACVRSLCGISSCWVLRSPVPADNGSTIASAMPGQRDNTSCGPGGLLLWSGRALAEPDKKNIRRLFSVITAPFNDFYAHMRGGNERA
jgi:radical SAM protein with 4Fe4S-binding SPASM domain